MANTLRFKRGLASGIPTALAGEPLFTTDTFDLYIGNGTTNTRFQKYIASGATTQILRGDGSLYTFPLAISSPSNGQVLKYNGTSWVNDSDAGITGSGSAGQVAYFTGATTQAGSNNLFWDATNNRLGIGTNAPAVTLDVRNGVNLYSFGASFPSAHYLEIISNSNTDGYVNFRRVGAQNGPAAYYITGGNARFSYDGATGNTILGAYTNNPLLFFTNSLERARLHATGNFSIGTTSDSGQKLQVIGDTLMKGSGNTSATTALTVQNSDGNNILRLRNDFTAIFDVAGSSLTISGIANYTILQANQAFYFRSNGATAGRAFKIFDNASSLTGTTGANQNIQSLITFAPTSGTATYTDLDLTSTINQTGGANGITRGLYVRPTLTAAADWRSIEWSNNSGWGLYGAGTANNYMAGSLGIGTTSPAGLLDVNGSRIYFRSTSATGTALRIINTATNGRDWGIGSNFNTGTGEFAIYDYTANAERMRISSTGNTLIGSTTDSGEKLQVTGTAKITSTLSVGDTSTTNIVNITGATASNAELRLINGTTRQVRFASRGDISQVLLDADTWDMGIRTIGSKFLFFATNGTERMRLDASGNLGLGVTPSAWGSGTRALQVSASASYIPSMSYVGGEFELAHNTYYNGTNWIYTGTGYGSTRLRLGVQGAFAFFTTGNVSGTAGGTATFTQAMTLTAAGRLLLNQTSDTGEQLQVTGTAKITGAAAINAALTITNATGPSLKVNHTAAGHAAGWFDTNEFGILVSSASTSASHYLTNMTSGGTSRFRVNCDGGVIMTGNLTVDTNTLFVDATNNRVGILTATPSTTLDVGGNATIGLTSTTGYSLVVQNSGANDTSGIRLTSGGTDNGYFITAYNSVSKYASLQAGDNTAYRNIVLNLLGGNVGIGISPTEKLHVSGNAIVTGNLTVDTNTLFVDATNNEVGIGTNAPNSVLHVAGSVAKQISSVKTANYTATATDYTILCDATSGGFTVTLPAASGIAGRIYIIKKINASSGVNSITVDGNASETIDGSATINLSCKSSVMLQCDGSNWHILSLYTDTSCL